MKVMLSLLEHFLTYQILLMSTLLILMVNFTLTIYSSHGIEAILYQGPLQRFSFCEKPFSERYLVLTRSAVRIYENKQQALSTYGRPIVAIPLAAVKKVERIKFDILREDIRFEGVPDDHIAVTLTKNMFEFLIKDEFLPIYTHQ